MLRYLSSIATLSAAIKSVPVKTINAARPKHAITFTIVLLVMSSPIVIIIDPVAVQAGPLLGEVNTRNKVDTSSYHSSLTVSETFSPTPSLISPSNSISSTPTIQAALIGPASFRSTDIVNSNSIYEIAFITTTTGTIKKIEITFPAGTIVGAAGVIEKVGIGHGFLTKSGTTVTLNIHTPVSIPAGTYIRLEMVDVKNPPNPGSNYNITVTTRGPDPDNSIIDGPSTSNAYIIKQVGTAEIASGSITKEKVSSSFMISRLLQDNARGNSFGWDPDGLVTNFIIIDDVAITGSNPVLINVGDSGTNSQCDALGSLTGFFTIQCLDPPPQGSELRYTITNLALS
ncbi:MAG: hypothetical protein WA941_18885 [Nitrososphaeraceae archaeon]